VVAVDKYIQLSRQRKAASAIETTR
jgi:hypothetical protein